VTIVIFLAKKASRFHSVGFNLEERNWKNGYLRSVVPRVCRPDISADDVSWMKR